MVMVVMHGGGGREGIWVCNLGDRLRLELYISSCH